MPNAANTRKKLVLNPENSNTTNSNMNTTANNKKTRKNSGKPPRHPKGPRGPITPLNRRGRPRNIQNYPEVVIRPPTVANKYVRFPSAKHLKEKNHVPLNMKRNLVFGTESPKTWEEIQ
jgi:hypothetical protein